MAVSADGMKVKQCSKGFGKETVTPENEETAGNHRRHGHGTDITVHQVTEEVTAHTERIGHETAKAVLVGIHRLRYGIAIRRYWSHLLLDF